MRRSLGGLLVFVRMVMVVEALNRVAGQDEEEMD